MVKFPQKDDKLDIGDTIPPPFPAATWNELCDIALASCIIDHYMIQGEPDDTKWFLIQEYVKAKEGSNTLYSWWSSWNSDHIKLALRSQEISTATLEDDEGNVYSAPQILFDLGWRKGLDTTDNDDIMKLLPRQVIGIFPEIVEKFLKIRNYLASSPTPWLEYFYGGHAYE